MFVKEDKKFVKIVRTVCLIAVAGGCVLSPKLVWNLADIAMALLAIVNLISITMLTNKFMICFKDYLRQKNSKKEIVFKATDCGIEDTTLWK